MDHRCYTDQEGDRKYFFLLALFEPFLYFLGESFGLTYVSSTVGSVIISTIPVFAVIFAWVFYRERLKLINYVGVIVSFLGVLIFITNSRAVHCYEPERTGTDVYGSGISCRIQYGSAQAGINI